MTDETKPSSPGRRRVYDPVKAAAYYAANKEWIRARNNAARLADPLWNAKKRVGWLRRKWGLTDEKLTEMKEARGYTCPICLRSLEPGASTHIDHCHRTGRIRGLLCNPCNRAIGYLRDNPSICEAAARYLRENRK